MISGTNRTKRNSPDPFIDNDYHKIFNELYVPLCQYTLKFVNNKNTAEDIVQDIFVYLWENWKRLESINSIKAYLFTAVKNRSLNYLQKQFSNLILQEIDECDNLFQDMMQPSALELLECEELEMILEKALDNLPEKCHIIFTLKRFAGKSNKEIAEHLEISVKTVEAQMTIAIKKLTAYVNTHWNESLKKEVSI